MPSSEREERLSFHALRGMRLLRALMPDSGFLEIRTFSPPRQRFFDLGHADAIYDALDYATAINDEDVLFGPHARIRQSGTADDVESCTSIFADCDSDAAIDALASFAPTPSFVVESGGVTELGQARRHAYWLLSEPIDPETARDAKRRLAAALDSDSVHDPSRVLKVPGSTYHKDGSGRPVRVVEANELRYSLEQVVGALPSVDQRPATNGASNGAITAGGRPELVALLGTALRKIGASIGRNSAMFDFACRARDAGYTADELIAEAAQLVDGINALAPGDHPYDRRELEQSIRSAFKRTPRTPAPTDDDWPDLSSGDLPTFPVDVLPSAVADWIRAVAEHAQTPADLPALAALGVLSTAALGRAVVDCGAWEEELGLFLIAALDSGERKSTVLKQAIRPLQAIESERQRAAEARIHKLKARRAALEERSKKLTKMLQSDDASTRAEAEDELATLSAQLAALPQAVEPRLFAGDVTPEALGALLADHAALGVLAAESALIDNLLGRYSDGRANLHLVCSAYTGEPYVIDRKGESRRLERPLLAFLLTVQPHVLAKLLANETARAQGLVARFAYALPETLVGRRRVNVPRVRRATELAWSELVYRVAGSADNADATRSAEFTRAELVSTVSRSEPEKISLSLGAGELLTELQRQTEPRLGPGGDLHSIGDWANRHHGRVARIAGLLHLCEHDAAEPLSSDTMSAALAIGDYLLEHAVAAFAVPDDDVRKALRWLERRGEPTVTQRDLHRGPKGSRGKAEDARRLADQLETVGAVRLLTDQQGARIYVVHPELCKPSEPDS